MEKSYKEYLQHIKTFVFDVDGVLTDGNVLINSEGELFRSMNTKDGFALKTAISNGYTVVIISGGTNEGVRLRLNGLGVTDVFLGVQNKKELLSSYLHERNLDRDHVLFMGDDIPDLMVMQHVGLPCCPQDAVPEIKEICTYVSHKNGGKGCVRDVIEQVLKVQGNWNFKENADAKFD